MYRPSECGTILHKLTLNSIQRIDRGTKRAENVESSA